LIPSSLERMSTVPPFTEMSAPSTPSTADVTFNLPLSTVRSPSAWTRRRPRSGTVRPEVEEEGGEAVRGDGEYSVGFVALTEEGLAVHGGEFHALVAGATTGER
jgi:hypothetical protein